MTQDSPTAPVQQVPQRISAAWAEHDAGAFAAVFTEDATLILPGDVFVKGRERIREFMDAAFAGPYRGTRVFGEPVDLTMAGPDVAVIVTRGGVLAPGEAEVAPERAIRATWVVARHGDDWLIQAYQNTPAGNA